MKKMIEKKKSNEPKASFKWQKEKLGKFYKFSTALN